MQNADNNKVMRLWMSVIALIIVVVMLALAIYREKTLSVLTDNGLHVVKCENRIMLGTFVDIIITCQDPVVGQQAIEAALSEVQRINVLISTYSSDSELSRVNDYGAMRPISVSHETFYILQKAHEYSVLSDGGFDITIPPLSKLWQQAEKDQVLPVDGSPEFTRAMELVDYEGIILKQSDDEYTVAFAREGMKINVNAIAKGYIVDKAMEVARKYDIQGAMVNIGGEIACFGVSRNNVPWPVGIQDPFKVAREGEFNLSPAWRVVLNNYAIATSGSYQDYIEIAGKRYGHIIDPRSGKPIKALPSVTVLARDVMTADALATAISVLGLDKGIALIESIEGVEAMVIIGDADDHEVVRSSGFALFEK